LKKMYYSLFVILVCFIGIINAKALTVQFNGSAFSGGATTNAENCWQYGCNRLPDRRSPICVKWYDMKRGNMWRI